MKIIIQNINGLRAAHKRGLFDRLQQLKPDIICFQEIRLSSCQLTTLLKENDKNLSAYHHNRNHGSILGYAGTAILSIQQPHYTSHQLHNLEDNQGRVIICEYELFFLVNVYVPNGGNKNQKVGVKISFLDSLLGTLHQLHKTKEVILCGDFNIAHYPIDLSQPTQNKTKTGFLKEERAILDQLVMNGYVDVCRLFYPNSQIYSWYSYYAKNKGLEIGWRFDYVFVTSGLLSKITSFSMPKNLDYSDHCPMILDIQID